MNKICVSIIPFIKALPSLTMSSFKIAIFFGSKGKQSKEIHIYRIPIVYETLSWALPFSH